VAETVEFDFLIGGLFNLNELDEEEDDDVSN